MLRQIVFPALLALAIALPAYAAFDPHIDFRRGAGQDAMPWLEQQGFTFEQAAHDPSRARFTLDERGLTIEALKPSQALLAMKQGLLKDYHYVELAWGVDRFPPDASYAQGRRNEAVMFYAFFGTETVGSGSLVVPDMPYFIALHLCENDTINKPELGRYFHQGGRFICVAHPNPGELIKTRFNLKKAFRDIYGFEPPPLSGIAIEYDTTGAGNGGKTSAFIQSINFPAATYLQAH